MSTRNDYLALFADHTDAVEYEALALSIGSDLLPATARAVRDGADLTPEYWEWLCSQVPDYLSEVDE